MDGWTSLLLLTLCLYAGVKFNGCHGRQKCRSTE